MLLRHEVCDGVQVLSVDGQVRQADVDGLLTEVQRLVALEPPGVVLDLAASSLDEPAREGLRALASQPAGWPRSALVMCPDRVLPEVPAAMTAPSRDAALARVGDRLRRPRTRVAVPADVTGPAHARAAVSASSQHLGLAELHEDVALVVSEMVTNAVRHAAPPVHLEVEAGDDEVVVAVCDGSPEAPAPRAADEDAEGGRGMMLVDLLSEAHGVRHQPPGKTVWARLRRRRS